MNVADFLELAASKPSQVSRMSGVSRATINRLHKGIGKPSLDTLEELAASLGYEVRIKVVPSGDPYAAIAARVLLDPMMPESTNPKVTKWLERFDRYGLTDPTEIVSAAGKRAAPQHHADAVFFAPRPGFDVKRIAAVAYGAGGENSVISGAAAASVMLNESINGATVLWAENVAAAADNLNVTFKRASSFQPAGIVVVPAPAEIAVDAFVLESVQYVAPSQVLLDLVGLGMLKTANQLNEEWNEWKN